MTDNVAFRPFTAMHHSSLRTKPSRSFVRIIERCAQLAEARSVLPDDGSDYELGAAYMAEEIAEAIRELKE